MMMNDSVCASGRLILASASPRRREILQRNGHLPEIIPANVDETVPFDTSPRVCVMYLAFKKAYCVYKMLSSMDVPRTPFTVIGADTVVTLDGRIIGKPADQREAFTNLSAMRNRSHHVYTGVCIIDNETKLKRVLYDDTEVFFGNYTDFELSAYISTDEPYDKAGGYAIQGAFGKYIDHIDGDLDNVIGLPYTAMKEYL